MDLKIQIQEFLVGPFFFVKGHPDRLGAIFVGALNPVSRGVSDNRFENALLAIELALRAPESSHCCLKGHVDVLRGRDALTACVAIVLYDLITGATRTDRTIASEDLDSNAIVSTARLPFTSRRNRDGTKGCAFRNPCTRYEQHSAG